MKFFFFVKRPIHTDSNTNMEEVMVMDSLEDLPFMDDQVVATAALVESAHMVILTVD